jgi:hypothetical protein
VFLWSSLMLLSKILYVPNVFLWASLMLPSKIVYVPNAFSPQSCYIHTNIVILESGILGASSRDVNGFVRLLSCQGSKQSAHP